MISGRRAAREAALLVIFSLDARRDADANAALSAFQDSFRADPEVLKTLFSDEEADPDDAKAQARLRKLLAPEGTRWAFVERLVHGVIDHKRSIDELIARCSLNWKVPRMANVDRNILRLAAYELVFEPDVPTRVTLNEAIEIAKRYGTEDSGAFVNGILDRIAQELAGAE